MSEPPQASFPTTGAFAVTRTKRRRLLWCAWWTAPPARDPFRPPDAWAGGARTEDEARIAAEKAAGRPLRPIEGRWAGAWVRVRAGLPPWPARDGDDGAVAPARPRPEGDSLAVLGLPQTASLEEIRGAFRRAALATHPDHGGDPEAFRRVQRAYDTLVARRQKKRRRGR